MAELRKFYTQTLPACRFVGKKYPQADMGPKGFSAQWELFFENGWFDRIEAAAGGAQAVRALYEDGGAYVALERWGNTNEYWIGMLTPPGAPAAEGFEFSDLPAMKLGVVWVYGAEPDIYGKESECMRLLQANGLEPDKQNGDLICMERYACPRYTTPDENGNIILDICFAVR